MIGWLHDPRLRPLALSPSPAWLWAPDATRLLWANPAGAAIFGAATPAALAVRSFDRTNIATAEVARIADSLQADSAPRLERLRGFGAPLGRMLTCACARITLADGASAVLIAAVERAGPDLPLDECISKLLAACVEPIAVFSDDGTLIAATSRACRLIGDKTSLDELAAITIERVHEPPVWFATLGERIAALAPATAVAPAPRPPAPPAPVPARERPPEPVAAIEDLTHDTATAVQPELFPELPPLPPPSAPVALEERRHPLRFVWQMDPEGRFTIDSEEFLALMGPRTAALNGQPWTFIASVMMLDPEGEVARAVATRATWSGVSVLWRVDGSHERLAVELSGLPVFDRERVYGGYRGFGVCRNVAQLNAIARERQAGASIAEAPAPEIPVSTARSSAVRPEDAPGLTPVERYAFNELSRRLTSRINEADARAQQTANANVPLADQGTPTGEASRDTEPAVADQTRPFLDRLPIGVLVYRLSDLLYANKAFLDWTSSDSLDALAEAGGLDSLMIESGDIAIEEGGRQAFSITSLSDESAVAEARLLQVPWDGESAFALLIMPAREDTAAKPAAKAAAEMLRGQVTELNAILDTAIDGVIVIDRAAQIVSSNRGAQVLFGYDASELEGKIFAELFAPESIGTAIDHLERLQGKGAAAFIGGEVTGHERLGGLIPLFMTMGRLGDDSGKYCVVFRDITSWKKTEEELTAAKLDAERASLEKSDLLAKVGHEIRTPLNAIIGFSEAMTEERFGPIGNERYRHYLKDIHASGTQLISLVDDLLDLSKIEAGTLDLTFASISLNELTQQCVAIMQPQASRERIIIRTSLSPRLPQVLADARSVRQIVLNLLSNSIKFTAAGGQVIVSTAIADTGEVVLRVRDTGVGMSEQALASALEPFRQVATTTRGGSGDTGLGLPLTKALAEANQATFHIKSKPNEGTLVEITFPGARLMAAQ